MIHALLDKINFILILMLIVLFSLYRTTSVQAHVGGGPPFLRINGEYAQTNPLIIAYPDSELHISQDSMTKNPITGTPIDFTVETDKLALETDLTKTAVFRWNWGDNSDTSIGSHVTHTYSKDGPYLVIVEMGFPQQNSFIVLDTVLIQSIPYANYVLPKPHIMINPATVEIGKPVSFSYDSPREKGTYIKDQKWRLDNNEYSTEKKPNHIYKAQDSTNIIIVKITDSNGFVGFAGIALDATNGVVEKKDISNSGNLISQSSVKQRQLLYYGITVFLILCILVYFISRKLQKKYHS